MYQLKNERDAATTAYLFAAIDSNSFDLAIVPKIDLLTTSLGLYELMPNSLVEFAYTLYFDRKLFGFYSNLLYDYYEQHYDTMGAIVGPRINITYSWCEDNQQSGGSDRGGLIPTSVETEVPIIHPTDATFSRSGYIYTVVVGCTTPGNGNTPGGGNWGGTFTTPGGINITPHRQYPRGGGTTNSGGNTGPSTNPLAKELADVLELNEANLECLGTMMLNPALSAELLDLAFNADIMNPCKPAESHEDILAAAIEGLCENFGEYIGIEDLYEELGKDDYIILSKSFSNNQKVNCIWEKIINANQELICSTLSNFFGGTKINLNLYVQSLNGQSGITDILPEGGIAISLDEEYIEKACPIEILETILHESIHAEILRRQNTYTLSELEQLYPEMMSYFYDPNVTDFHHEYMANEWFDDLLDAIISFYPTGFTIEQYQAIVWSGLHNTKAFSQHSGMTTTEISNIINSTRQNCDKSCD